MEKKLIQIYVSEKQANLLAYFSIKERIDKLERLMRDGFFDFKGGSKTANIDYSGVINDIETRSKSVFDRENKIMKKGSG